MAESISALNVAWLAGLLEGEGCFISRPTTGQPIIQLIMTDPDVVQRAATLMEGRWIRCASKTKSGKSVYRCNLYGPQAIGWMLTLYSLMGVRRRAKIRECVLRWRSTSNKKQSMTKFWKKRPDRAPQLRLIGA